MDTDVFNFIVKDMKEIVEKYLGDYKISLGISDEQIKDFSKEILEKYLLYDIERIVVSDPAVRIAKDHEHDYVYKNYKGIRAILYYRIANKLILDNTLIYINSNDDDEYYDPLDDSDEIHASIDYIFTDIARKISEDASVITTIEINPYAKIGKGFVIDHGVNTKIDSSLDIVVGETSVIGENCTILNGVVLGALDVNTGSIAKTKRRHPVLKNNVTVCSNVKILGNVTIGNNVFISPNCIVTNSVPANTNVTMINELQISKKKGKSNKKTIIYGVVPEKNNVHLYGENLDNAILKIVDNAHKQNNDYEICINDVDNEHIMFRVELKDSKRTHLDAVYLYIETDFNIIYIYNSHTINKVTESLVKER